MPRGNRRSQAAKYRENTKRGILGTKEAREVDIDPTYGEDESHDLAPDNDALQCAFYPISCSLPVYHIEFAPTPLISSPLSDWSNDSAYPISASIQAAVPEIPTRDASVMTLTADSDLEPDWEASEVRYRCC